MRQLESSINGPKLRVRSTRRQLDAVLESWAREAPDSARRIGLALLMENAEPIRTPAETAFWAVQGIRLIGPAWHANRYSGDTKDGGLLTPSSEFCR